jgi:hypothetical protein
VSLIPCEEISFVDPMPIGEGDRGTVYRAVWSCPKKINTLSSQEIDVALKSIKLKGADLDRFMKEVRDSKKCVYLNIPTKTN